jgi:hypothetical protein
MAAYDAQTFAQSIATKDAAHEPFCDPALFPKGNLKPADFR